MAKKMSVEDLYRLFKAVSTAKLVRTDREPAQVLPGLYLGSIGAAFSLDVLKEHGITHVLCVASGIAPRYGGSARTAAERTRTLTQGPLALQQVPGGV